MLGNLPAVVLPLFLGSALPRFRGLGGVGCFPRFGGENVPIRFPLGLVAQHSISFFPFYASLLKLLDCHK